jgi:PAS domain S-box-containing protein
MKESIVIGLIRNIALLLTFSILYDHFWTSRIKSKNVIFKLIAGVFLGCVAIILILTPWNYSDGVFFDTRSVMLSISGLFFGPIPTVIAMIVASVYRLFLGGPGAYMGVAVILTSGTIGVMWNYLRPNWQNRDNSIELTTLGLLVHVVMLACILFLPAEMRLLTFKEIFFPVLILYPFATVLLGKYIIRQNTARNTKKELHASEKRWQFALEGAGDGIWDWNLDTNRVYFSKQWKNMLGYEEDEIENNLSEWKERIHPGDLEKVDKLIQEHINGESTIYSSEHRLLCKDGTFKWILDSGKIMQRDENGKPLRFIGTHKDISDRKEKELLLAHERFLLDSLMNFTPESIYFKDLNSRFIRVNKVEAMNLGCDNVADVIGKTDFDFYEKEFATKTYNIEQEIIRTGNSYHNEELGHIKSGRANWGITNKMPLRNSEGKIIGTFGLTINITERKLTEQALQESERYTNSILRAIPDLIFILDSDGVYLDFRTGRPQDLAVPIENFIDKSIFEVLPKPVAQLIKEKIDLVLKTEAMETLEYQIELNGRLTDFECLILPFGENKVITMVRNISKRKQIEADLKNSQEQLKNFAAHLQNVREEERVSLAREIHDELGQILIALKIDLGISKQIVFKAVKKSAIDDVSTRFNQMYSLVDKTIKTTRKIMTGLRPEVLELVGFQEAARLFTLEFMERYHIHCNFTSPTPEVQVDSQQAIALFRILQEALTNIAKHANATEVEVVVNVVDNKFVMKISDNGVGFDENKQIRQDSYGLIGMKERVYLLDGKLTVIGKPGVGTTVFVEMPYNTKATH